MFEPVRLTEHLRHASLRTEKKLLSYAIDTMYTKLVLNHLHKCTFALLTLEQLGGFKGQLLPN